MESKGKNDTAWRDEGVARASIYFPLKANFISNNFSLLFYGLYKKARRLVYSFFIRRKRASVEEDGGRCAVGVRRWRKSWVDGWLNELRSL